MNAKEFLRPEAGTFGLYVVVLMLLLGVLLIAVGLYLTPVPTLLALAFAVSAYLLTRAWQTWGER